MLVYYLIIDFLIGVVSAFNRNRTVRILLLALFMAVQTTMTIYAYLHLNMEDLGYFKYDAIGVIFMCVLTLLSYTTIYHSYIYLRHRQDDSRSQSLYFSALIMLIIAMTCVYIASHIGLMWVFIELTTLSVAVLIYHERTPLALEATWKYVFVCSIGITITFIGIILLSFGIGETETINFSFKPLQVQLLHVNPSWLKLSFLFIIIGFCTKMGLLPMHTAAIDAHTVAPPPISAFISTTLMNVGFVAIFRTYTIIASTSILPWANNILLISGTLSVFVAAVYLLRVNHFKRMSAYSSLENMGIVAIGLGTGGIGYYAVFLHLIFHSFTTASLFYQIQQVHRVYKSYLIRPSGGSFKYYTPGAMVILLVFICITAMPPSGMFISEFMIFRAMFEKHYIGLLVLILILLTLAMWALGKNFFRLIYAPPVNFDSSHVGKISLKESLSQFILLGLVFYLGFNPPQQMVDLINEAIKNLPH